jgi:murein endopeptidase
MQRRRSPRSGAGLLLAGLLVAALAGLGGAAAWPHRAGGAAPLAAARPLPRRAVSWPPAPEAGVVWHRSRALGRPNHGRLAGGVLLPAEGRHFVSWDAVHRSTPNPVWRRWGTDRLVRTLLRVAAAYAVAHPRAPRLVVGDLSRRRGGPFGRRFGGDGHRSHQNGLDVDVFYPRRDGRERAPRTVAQVDRALAQDLVARFVRAGSRYVFVGPHTGLHGPPRVVQPLWNHDDHLHVRIRGR